MKGNDDNEPRPTTVLGREYRPRLLPMHDAGRGGGGLFPPPLLTTRAKTGQVDDDGDGDDDGDDDDYHPPRRCPSSSSSIPPPSASNDPRLHPSDGRRTSILPLISSHHGSAANPSRDDDDVDNDVKTTTVRRSSSPRSTIRRVTGFSLTALRSTLRVATGFSLTALRATLRTATGISLSGTMSDIVRRVLDVLSPSMRYFLQPLLIAYYAPLLILRYWIVGPSSVYVEESRMGHERIVEGWRRAVEAAERANTDGYWPVHLNDDGTIMTSLPPDVNDVVDLTDGIERSVAATTETFATC